MGKKLYVGNLSSDTTESELRTLFGDIGEIEALLLSPTYDSGRSSGYGFVEMETYDEALAAIRALNGIMLHGRLRYTKHTRHALLQVGDRL